MQLGLGLTSLLASLVVAISAPEFVDAAPLQRNAPVSRRAPNGMVTMPLRRVQQRDDLRPQLVRALLTLHSPINHN